MRYMIHTRLYPIWHKGIKLPQARANRPKAAHNDLHCVSPDTLLAGFDPLIALLLYLLPIATASILDCHTQLGFAVDVSQAGIHY